MIEPNVLSAFWIEYHRPVGEVRERCICGSPECAVEVVKDEDGTERRVGVEIVDGRLVYVQADGLMLYLCFLERGRAGRESALAERVKEARPPVGSPLLPGLVARIWRRLRAIPEGGPAEEDR